MGYMLLYLREGVAEIMFLHAYVRFPCSSVKGWVKW